MSARTHEATGNPTSNAPALRDVARTIERWTEAGEIDMAWGECCIVIRRRAGVIYEHQLSETVTHPPVKVSEN